MIVGRAREPRLGSLLLFGLIAGAIGGLLFQVGLIFVSGASLSSAIFSLAYLIYTIPAGVIIGVVAALCAGLIAKVVPEAKSSGFRVVLLGCAALLGATFAAELTAIPFYLGPPPFLPSVVIGVLAGVGFSVYVFLRLKTRRQSHDQNARPRVDDN